MTTRRIVLFLLLGVVVSKQQQQQQEQQEQQEEQEGPCSSWLAFDNSLLHDFFNYMIGESSSSSCPSCHSRKTVVAARRTKGYPTKHEDSKCFSRSLRRLFLCLLLSILFNSTQTAAAASSSSLYNMSIVCTLLDGSVVTLNAETGELVSSFATHRPLLTAASTVVPDVFTGHLYDRNTLQALPVTIPQLLQSPLQTCNRNNRECFLVTGTKHVSWYGLDAATGALQWTTQAPSPNHHHHHHHNMNDDDMNDHNMNDDDDDMNDHHDIPKDRPVVLLQREDYLVQQVSTGTGQELWNVTVGHFAALDFGTRSSHAEPTSLVLDGGSQQHNADNIPPLPRVMFDAQGTTLTVLSSANSQLLWTRRFDHVIARVYGLAQGTWWPLTHADAPSLLLQLPSNNHYNNDVKRLWKHPFTNHYTWKDTAVTVYQPTPQLLSVQPKDTTSNHFPWIPSDPLWIAPSPAPPPAGGLFLTWPMLIMILISFLIFMLGLVQLYFFKKQQWITASSPQLGPTNTNSLSPTIVRRTMSLPLLNHTSPETTTTTHTIPLVRYSRYRSEFQQLAPLGQGGFGSVYKCRNQLDGGLYAVKRVVCLQESLPRVLREVKILAMLHHAHIVRYYTAWLELPHDEEDGDACQSSTWSTRGEEESSVMQQQQQETFTDNSSLSAFGFHFDREDDQVHSEPSLGKQQQLHEPRKSVTFQETQSQKPADGKKRHFLYIQMQLCGQQTLADFLSNPNARGSEVDIPYALKLFHQVANGVKYVHEQDLIHRDLKPNNCFLDDSGIVKVGDFGLSREANADVNGLFRVDQDQQDHDNNTAGVGTRSYASPEQLQGSDYDASTDIFSLGLILFELCYPMYTSMERLTEFTRLRKQEFPESWLNGVAKAFPDVHAMLVAMLSTTPSERPSAAEIVDRVERVLGEFTVMTIAQTEHSSLLLRVEADPSDGVLARTMKLIRDSAPGVKIEQYGLRGGESTSVIEFALSNTDEVGLNNVLEAMKACPEIKRVRQVSHTSRERSTSIHEI